MGLDCQFKFKKIPFRVGVWLSTLTRVCASQGLTWWS